MATVAVLSAVNGAVGAAASCEDLSVEGMLAMIAVEDGCLGRAGIDISVAYHQ